MIKGRRLYVCHKCGREEWINNREAHYPVLCNCEDEFHCPLMHPLGSEAETEWWYDEAHRQQNLKQVARIERDIHRDTVEGQREELRLDAQILLHQSARINELQELLAAQEVDNVDMFLSRDEAIELLKDFQKLPSIHFDFAIEHNMFYFENDAPTRWLAWNQEVCDFLEERD